MSRSPGWRRLFRLPVDRFSCIEPAVDAELKGHFERRIEELVGQGGDVEDARRLALEEFGDLETTRRYCSRMSRRVRRRARVRRALSELLHDLVFAARLLRRSPGLTLVVVLALALGVGASATIFRVFDDEGRHLAGITEPAELSRIEGGTSYQMYRDYRHQTRAFSALAAWRETRIDVGSGDATRPFRAMLVSSNYFAVLGASMVHGRVFTPAEERDEGADPVVIISNRLWRIRFGGARDILRSHVTLNGRDFVVVGVAPERFHGHWSAANIDLWVPLASFRQTAPGLLASTTDMFTWLDLVGRLRPGAQIEQVRAEVAALEPRLSVKEFPASNLPESTFEIASAGILIIAPGLLLLAIWANLSSLFLARLARRRGEIAVRLSLGVGRARLFRQLLSEGLLLALLGGAAGLVVYSWCAYGLEILFGPEEIGEFGKTSAGIDVRLFTFALSLSVLSGVVFGLASGRWVSRLDFTAAMKGRAGATERSSPLRGLLVVSQITVSLSLLTCAGLLLDALPEFSTGGSIPAADHILLASVRPSRQGLSDEEGRAFYSLLQQGVAALPGVDSVSLARNTDPRHGRFFSERRVRRGDLEAAPETAWLRASFNVITPRHFATLGTELLAGRDFEPTDRDGAPHVVIVNETLAHRLWPGERAVGKTLRFQSGGERAVRQIVGVAKDRPSGSESRPFVYFPMFQANPWEKGGAVLHVRTIGDPMALLPAVQEVVRGLHPDLPVFDVTTLSSVSFDGMSMFDEWIVATVSSLVAIAGLLTLALAGVALYGVMSYGVAERTREIGVRMAVGAHRGDVLRQVLWQGLRYALIGTAVGLLATFVLARILSSQFYPIPEMNPIVFVVVSITLTGVSLLASLLPAHRASGVDPVEALRGD